MQAPTCELTSTSPAAIEPSDSLPSLYQFLPPFRMRSSAGMKARPGQRIDTCERALA